MRYIRKAGLLYAVVPPSTNTNVFFGSFASSEMTSGWKYTGAAVLARTICQRGRSRLQSGRALSLYFAQGLLEMGQAESVVAFRVTARNRDRRCCGSSVVVSPKVSWSFRCSGPLAYSDFHRAISARLVNASRPNSR